MLLDGLKNLVFGRAAAVNPAERLDPVLEREQGRATPLSERMLEAASLKRPIPGDHVSPFEWSRQAEAGLTTVRQRARHSYQNNAYAHNGVDAWIANTIGAGINASSAAPDADTRQMIGERFTRWCEVADSDGRTDFFGIQTTAFQDVVVAGESLVALLSDPLNGALRLKILPPERLDSSKNSEANPRIVAGVEMDANDRRLAYWITQPNSYASIRVPAESILHVFKASAPSQVRGISWLAPVLLNLNEEDGLRDALLMAARISACFAGFLTDQNTNGGPIPFDGVQTGSTLVGGLEPGQIKVLPSGMSIQWAQPAAVKQGIELAKLTIEAVASGLGCPAHLVSSDLSNANYSSLRAGLVEFRQRIEQVQFHVLVPQLLSPIWKRWLIGEYLSGAIDLPRGDLESLLAVNWYPPALPWVDPLKDLQSEVLAVSSGLKSRRQAVAERGYSVEQLDEEIAQDNAREGRLGLVFGDGTVTPRPNTQTRVLEYDAEGRILRFETRNIPDA
ncbi:MAG TPA: phage portal protein [Stellaceae bacterium]|nr:phage portal protein [Stellaceae bacterium]